MGRVVDARHVAAAARVRARLATYEEHRDLVVLGAYQAGRDAAVDEAISGYPAAERFLTQARDEIADWDHSLASLLTLAGPR
jgi:flagellum-specific ATP synthase